MSNFAKYGIAGIITCLVFSAFWSTLSDDGSSQIRANERAVENASINASRIAAAKEAVPLLIDSGLVYRIEAANHRAYVYEQYWSKYDIDEKSAAAASLGYFIQSENGDSLGIDIFGAQSGKRLGQWNDKTGYKAE